LVRRAAVRKVGVVVLVAAFGLAGTSCHVGAAMWTDCSNVSKDDQFGTDLSYVLHCEGGTWRPIMTVGEYFKILLHQPVVIAPLPVEPTTTTTVVPTTPAAGCYADSNQAHGDLSFAGRIFHADAATYPSTNGTCTGDRTVETVVYAGSLTDAFDACVALGEQGVSENDLSTFGDGRLTNLWVCLDA
jgi:hypothetical protein